MKLKNYMINGNHCVKNNLMSKTEQTVKNQFFNVKNKKERRKL